MKNLKPRRAVLFGCLSAAWIGVLFFFSGQSGEASGGLSEWFTQLLFSPLIRWGLNADKLEFMLRKMAHFGIFAVAGFLVGMLFMHMLRRGWAIFSTLILSVGLAITNELHQTLSVGRSCSVRDMCIDSLGAVCGLIAAVVLLELIHFWQETREEKGIQ